MKTFLAAIAGLFVLSAAPVAVSAPANISQTVGVCDPSYPQRCIKPDTNGAVPVTTTLPTGSATAANQTSVQAPVTPATATATKSLLIGCQYMTALSAASNGQQGFWPCGTSGAGAVTIFGQNGTSGVTVGAGSADDVAASGTGLVGNARLMGFDGTTWDRLRTAGASGGVLLVSENGNSFTNITTATDTNVKASAGTFVGIVVNTAGVGSTAAVYNDADGTCSSGLIGTFSTTAQASLTVNATASIGICVTTTGGTPANITILYR